jgi:predicted RNA-binding Zn ribbon-like protein
MTKRRAEPHQMHDEHDQTHAPFIFIGQNIALDLVNTEKKVRGKLCDLLATPEAIMQWWHAALQHHIDSAAVLPNSELLALDNSAFSTVRAVRGSIRQLFGAVVDRTTPNAQAIDVLNSVLRLGHHTLMLDEQGTLQTRYATLHGGADVLLFTVTRSVVQLLESNRQRIHRCSNPRCVLFFYDTTKSATRRWCNLECMDRARSAKRYQASKQRSST